jgi:hypothetical protein
MINTQSVDDVPKFHHFYLYRDNLHATTRNLFTSNPACWSLDGHNFSFYGLFVKKQLVTSGPSHTKISVAFFIGEDRNTGFR